jgi:hypothetical protein
MKFGMGVMALNITSTIFNSVASTIPKWRTFQLLRWVLLFNRLLDLDDILYGDDIEGDLDSILLNPVALIIPRWLTFKLLWWVQF